ncbi:MAG: MFS transporter [Thermoplasmata archaeon]|nr:MFS transporter [Thermoplasmata archaeon]
MSPAAEDGPRAALTYRRLLGNRNFLRVFTAGLGSVAGSAISSVCLVWIVAVDTRSALDVAFLATAWIAAGILFSVFGGALVDRYDRRRLMILSDVARALAMTWVFVDLHFRGFDLPGILVAYFVIGAFTTVFNPAEQAIIPALVGQAEIAEANGLVRSSRSSLQFVGISVAGILIVTLGATVGVAVNALTFAVSAAILSGMRLAPHPSVLATAVRQGVRGYFASLSEGFRWLRDATGFLELTFSATFFNFCSNLIGTFLVFFATVVLHGSALDYAALLGMEVAGTAIGSLLVGRVKAVRWAGRAWTIPYGVGAGSVALVLALFPSVPVSIAALFAIGLLSGFAGTAWLTAAQILVPTEMQGRYFGIDGLGSIAVFPAAQIGGAFLILDIGVQHAYLVTALVWIAAGVAFLFPRALWQLGVRPGAPPVTRRSGDGASGTPGSPEGTRSG